VLGVDYPRVDYLNTVSKIYTTKQRLKENGEHHREVEKLFKLYYLDLQQREPSWLSINLPGDLFKATILPALQVLDDSILIQQIHLDHNRSRNSLFGLIQLLLKEVAWFLNQTQTGGPPNEAALPTRNHESIMNSNVFFFGNYVSSSTIERTSSKM
jgi:hypothetical protein